MDDIKRLEPSDLNYLIDLLRIYQEVFEIENFQFPDDDYLLSLLRKEDFHVFVSLHEGRVIAGLTGYTLAAYYESSYQMYLYDLGVTPAHQRKGVGRTLLNALKDYCHQKGYTEFYVQADLDDQHAMDFYQANGGVPQRVMHYTYAVRST